MGPLDELPPFSSSPLPSRDALPPLRAGARAQPSNASEVEERITDRHPQNLQIKTRKLNKFIPKSE